MLPSELMAMHRSSRGEKLILVAALLPCLLVAGEARADQPVLSVGARGEVMNGETRVFGGPGAEVELGYAFDVHPLIYIMPEVSATGAIYLPSPVTGGFRGTGGLQVGVTLEVQPSAYVHVGYGGFAGKAGAFGPRDVAHTFTIDAGLSVDKLIERSFSIGGSIGYQGFLGDVNAHGAAFGFHVGFWL